MGSDSLARPVPAERILLLLCAALWVTSLLALLGGHLGPEDLSWTRDQLSSYAARAEHGGWVTMGMLLAAAAQLVLGLGLTRARIGGLGACFERLAALAFGAASAGLLLLATFQETARDHAQLKALTWRGVRQQSFHDAGLLVFFYAGLLALVLVGLGRALRLRNAPGIAQGVLLVLLALSAYAALRTAWPEFFGLQGDVHGLKQRMALFSMWCGAMLALAGLWNDRIRDGSARGRISSAAGQAQLENMS